MRAAEIMKAIFRIKSRFSQRVGRAAAPPCWIIRMQRSIALSLAFLLILPVQGYADTSLKAGIADSLNRAVPALLRRTSETLPAWVKRTDVSVRFDEDLKPLWSVETVQPLYQSRETVQHTFFTHGRFAHTTHDDTVNLGFGYRYLTDDENWLLGLNSFLDMTFARRHRRASVGAEIIGHWLSISANYYESFSPHRFYTESSGTRVSEKALDGWDVAGKVQIPFLPWAEAQLRGYGWQGVMLNDVEGYEISCIMNLTSCLVFEFGRSDDDAGENNYAQISCTLGGPERVEYTLVNSFIQPTFFSEKDLKKQVLAKVRREQDIVVEKIRSSASGSGGVTGGIIISRGN